MGKPYRMTVSRSFRPSSRLAVAQSWRAIANPTITDAQIAKVPPPDEKAVCTDAPIGTDTAVPTKKTNRTSRALPLTAFAAHVNVDHANHSTRNTSAASPAPPQVGKWTKWATSWENA